MIELRPIPWALESLLVYIVYYHKSSLQILQCTTCPCFQRYVQIYRSSINAKSMKSDICNLSPLEHHTFNIVLDVVQRHVSRDLFNVLHLGRATVVAGGAWSRLAIEDRLAIGLVAALQRYPSHPWPQGRRAHESFSREYNERLVGSGEKADRDGNELFHGDLVRN